MKIHVKDKSTEAFEVLVDFLPGCLHDRVTVTTHDIGYDEDGRYHAHETAICADCGATAIYERDEFEDTH